MGKVKRERLHDEQDFAQDAEGWRQSVIANVAYFTVCIFSGCGNYNREEFPTLGAAAQRADKRKGTQGRKPLVYAVSKSGRDVHVNEAEWRAAL